MEQLRPIWKLISEINHRLAKLSSGKYIYLSNFALGGISSTKEKNGTSVKVVFVGKQKPPLEMYKKNVVLYSFVLEEKFKATKNSMRYYECADYVLAEDIDARINELKNVKIYLNSIIDQLKPKQA